MNFNQILYHVATICIKSFFFHLMGENSRFERLAVFLLRSLAQVRHTSPLMHFHRRSKSDMKLAADISKSLLALGVSPTNDTN